MIEVPFFDLGKFINQNKPELMSAIERVIDKGIFVGGEEVETFERDFASSTGSKHCISVGNGLDALRLLLEANGIGPGDEVIVPGFTFYATWLAVMQTGAIPVAVDVQLTNASIDPNLLKQAISSRTKAILVVHLFGISVDMLSVKTVARQNQLLVFEDCAQAHFGQTNAGPVGNSCDGAAFSFYPTKNLGGLGDAGAITTNDHEVSLKMRSRRSYGVGATKYEHTDTGWNSRLDPLQAAVLNHLLPGLPSVTDSRRKIAKKYTEALASSTTEIVSASSPNENVFHHFVIRAADREKAQRDFAALGVRTDIHYPYHFSSLKPVQDLYASTGYQLPSLPNSALLASQVLSLPIGPWMSEEQVRQVESALLELDAS